MEQIFCFYLSSAIAVQCPWINSNACTLYDLMKKKIAKKNPNAKKICLRSARAVTDPKINIFTLRPNSSSSSSSSNSSSSSSSSMPPGLIPTHVRLDKKKHRGKKNPNAKIVRVELTGAPVTDNKVNISTTKFHKLSDTVRRVHKYIYVYIYIHIHKQKGISF